MGYGSDGAIAPRVIALLFLPNFPSKTSSGVGMGRDREIWFKWMGSTEKE